MKERISRGARSSGQTSTRANRCILILHARTITEKFKMASIPGGFKHGLDSRLISKWPPWKAEFKMASVAGGFQNGLLEQVDFKIAYIAG